MPTLSQIERDQYAEENSELRAAVWAYLSEFDNPVPDMMYRKTLRDRLRKLVGAPEQPAPRK